MIIHIWMHWFWITTSYLKGCMYFAILTISLFWVSCPRVAEARLLIKNETFISLTKTPLNRNYSSQLKNETSITELKSQPPTTASHLLLLSSSPQEEATTEDVTTPKPEDDSQTAFGSTGDLEDIYNGSTFDMFQYPLKKFTKYSHLKYGKVRPKGKMNEESEGEERKIESVKVIEAKVNINISAGEANPSGPEVDKSSERPFQGGPSEVSTSDAPDLITTIAFENVMSEGSQSETLDNVSKKEANVEGSLTPPLPPIEVLKNETLVIENKVEESGRFTTVETFAVRNRVAAATSSQNYVVEQSEMNAGSITAITLGILVIFSLFGAISFVLYRRRYLNKPQVFHDKCSNLDSSGYIDETSLRENSEEMYSLDNDSFLNSLEAMTIQNYWTESVKHTKL